MNRLLKLLLKTNRLEVFAIVAICVVMAVVTAWGWLILPHEITVSSWLGTSTSKADILGVSILMFILAVLSPLTFLVYTPLKIDIAGNMRMNQRVLGKFDWRNENLQHYLEFMSIFSVCEELLLISMNTPGLLRALGYPINKITIFGILFGVSIFFVGRYFLKVANHYDLGISTDWIGIHTAGTISNELIWTRFHVFVGKCFIVLGGVMVLISITGSFGVVLLSLIVGTLNLVIGARIILRSHHQVNTKKE